MLWSDLVGVGSEDAWELANIARMGTDFENYSKNHLYFVDGWWSLLNNFADKINKSFAYFWI
jgi:hypothetical protein